MIPKIIHYCWFGKKEKSSLAKKCIESWRKYCPDYEIIEWNEENFDLAQYPYIQWCYKNEKWAFLSDFARLLIIGQHGGIYFDTDVELLRNPDELLQYKAFYGFENKQYINTGEGFGAEPGNITVMAMVDVYKNIISNTDGSYPLIPCPTLNTQALLEFGLVQNGEKQSIDNAEIFSIEYFNPYDDPTGKLNTTKNTISIHWYSKSWMDKKTILRSKLTKPFHRVFGINCFRRLKR